MLQKLVEKHSWSRLCVTEYVGIMGGIFRMHKHILLCWTPVWMELLETEEPSPHEVNFGSKLQSLKNNILTFFFNISPKNED